MVAAAGENLGMCYSSSSESELLNPDQQQRTPLLLLEEREDWKRHDFSTVVLPGQDFEIEIDLQQHDEAENNYYYRNNNYYRQIPQDKLAVGSNGDNKYNSSHYDEEGMTKCLLEESGPLLLFPKEKRKTVISFVFMAFGFLVNATSIALTHDRVPDREVVLPLPDIFLDNFTQIPQLMFVPDVLVIMSLLMTASVILLHPHRWILARRTFFIIAVLYLLRSVTMFVTVLPVANKTVYCSPQVKSSSVSLLASRVIELSIGGGMQISGLKKSCGDYIFSGHTVIMVTAMLIVREYSPAKFWFLHGISTLTAWGGMGILLLAHGHYTIDVIIGYYASTRMFWTYHVLANNAQLKAAKRWEFYGQAWWFKLFHYFEANVAAPLPKPRVTNLRLPFRFR